MLQSRVPCLYSSSVNLVFCTSQLRFSLLSLHFLFYYCFSTCIAFIVHHLLQDPVEVCIFVSKLNEAAIRCPQRGCTTSTVTKLEKEDLSECDWSSGRLEDPPDPGSSIQTSPSQVEASVDSCLGRPGDGV